MRGESLTINEATVVYSPFSATPEVFFVEFGYIFAFTYDDNGKRRIHLIYGPGSYFPVLTVFKNTEQRASYEALTKVIVKKYKREDFLQELKTNIELSNAIVHKTVDQLGIFADVVINLQVTKLEDKLLGRLQNLAKAHGEVKKDGVTLPYKLTHYHLADMLGVERESVSRVLISLKKKKLIELDNHGCITILNKL